MQTELTLKLIRLFLGVEPWLFPVWTLVVVAEPLRLWLLARGFVGEAELLEQLREGEGRKVWPRRAAKAAGPLASIIEAFYAAMRSHGDREAALGEAWRRKMELEWSAGVHWLLDFVFAGPPFMGLLIVVGVMALSSATSIGVEHHGMGGDLAQFLKACPGLWRYLALTVLAIASMALSRSLRKLIRHRLGLFMIAFEACPASRVPGETVAP